MVGECDHMSVMKMRLCRVCKPCHPLDSAVTRLSRYCVLTGSTESSSFPGMTEQK